MIGPSSSPKMMISAHIHFGPRVFSRLREVDQGKDHQGELDEQQGDDQGQVFEEFFHGGLLSALQAIA